MGLLNVKNLVAAGLIICIVHLFFFYEKGIIIAKLQFRMHVLDVHSPNLWFKFEYMS